MKYPAYPEYKDSPIPWLPKVPANWEVHRLKWAVTSCDNGVWGEEADGGPDDVACIRVADFDRLRFSVSGDNLTMRSIDARQRASRQVRKGDLLIEKSGGGEKQLVGCVVRFDHDFPAVCSNFVARMGVAEGQNSRYWTYAHAALYAGRLNDLAIKQTTGIQNLDAGEYLNNLFAYAPAEDQERIADFLDWRTAQIDALIAKRKQLVNALREQRESVTFCLATRGLRQDVSLRDSGLPWVPHIPKHWRSGNIRRFATMKTGHTPSRSEPTYWEGCETPWFTLADVWQLRDASRIYLGDTKEKISTLGLRNSAAELLPKGTVVLSRTASVGYSGIMPIPMATSQDFWNWIPNEGLISEYLLVLFRAMKQEFRRLTMGSTHKTIYQPDAASLRICVPPPDEQTAIVEALLPFWERTDGLIARAEDSIETLTEYRSALITAAVTGQIDVRGVPVPAAA